MHEMQKFNSVNELVNTLRPVDPIYCIRPNSIKSACDWFKKSFPGQILYAVKTNPNEKVIKCIGESGIDKFDVALCLGSIHFGDVTKVTNQIVKVVSILKDTSRIYWRCNPGHHDHDDDMCSQISFFPWDEEWMEHFADMFNFKINFKSKICF